MLRRWDSRATALGVLAVPKYYLHDPAAVLISGDYGPVFGGPAFPAGVYSMHDPDAGGGYCAQAAVIMALGLLVDRGAQVTGSHTLTYLARPRHPSPQGR